MATDMNDYLSQIAQNTVLVMVKATEKKSEWIKVAQSEMVKARDIGDHQMETLLKAVILLLLGDPVEALKPDLKDEYATSWAQIVFGIQMLHNDTLGRNEIEQTVLSYLGASTLEAVQQLVEKHFSILISSEAQSIIENFADQYRGDINAVRVISMKRMILRRCQEVGIAQAFTEIREYASTPDNPQNNLMQVALGFMTDNQRQAVIALRQKASGSEEFQAALVEQPELKVAFEKAIQQALNYRQQQLGNLLQALSQSTSQKEISQRIAISQQALKLVDRSIQAELWAFLHIDLGNSLAQTPQGNQRENLELAIQHFQQAFLVLTREDFPQQWAMAHNVLADAYSKRIAGERRENLEEAIRHYEQALDVFTRQNFSQFWAMIQDSLGSAYSARIAGDRRDNLDLAIEHYQQALLVYTHKDFPKEWGDTQYNLGNSYREQITGDRSKNLENAIQCYQQALLVRTYDDFPKDWANIQNNIAVTYSDRIKGIRRENLETAIKHLQQALLVRTREDSPEDWAMTQNNLGTVFRKRISGDQRENLEQAIRYYEQALLVYNPEDFPQQWAATQNNLGNIYLERITGDRRDNLEKAIQHYQQALLVRTREDSPQDWAITLNNLGTTYVDRIVGDRRENLEQAIHYYEQALQVRTRGDFPQDWADTQNNLGTAYGNRIAGDRRENLEQAIQHFRQALLVRARQNFPQNWAMIQNNLADAYLKRTSGDRQENLEQAIHHYQQALIVFTHENFPHYWATAQNNLGNVYRDRTTDGRQENLEKAIQCYQQALLVHTYKDFPKDWADTQNNMGTAYGDRIEGNRRDNLEEAIHCYQQALSVRTRQNFPEDWAKTQNNLSAAYRKRIAGERQRNLEQAIYCYEQTLLEYRPDTNPVLCRMIASDLGDLAMETNNWAVAVQGFQMACMADEQLFQIAIGETSKQREVATIKDLYARSAYAFAKIGDFSRAVEALESGRARLLRETLEHNRKDLEQLLAGGHAEQYTRYQQASQHLQSLMVSRSADVRNVSLHTLEVAQQELQSSVEAIRRIPGYQDFLLSLSADAIQTLASKKPLVYVTVTTIGGLVLVVLPQTITPIWLEDLTEEAVREHVFGSDIPKLGGYVGAYVAWRTASGDRKQAAAANWQTALDQTMAWLWQAGIGRLVGILQQLAIREAVLIASGWLGLLPLHAAWIADPNRPVGRHYAMDEICFSYAPSAHTLRQAQKAVSRPAHTILAVDDPDGSLPSSTQEVDAAFEQFPRQKRKRLVGNRATKQAVLEAVPHYQILHFSTHGEATPSQPLEGYLLMANKEPLSLREVMQLKLDQARLGVLSACETGIPGFTLPDEVIGLPAGFLQAGVPGVIGSSWSVSDYSTMLLMSKFYENWRKGEGMELAEALRQAQIWLRDSRVCDLEAYLLQAMGLPITEKLPESAAHQTYWQLHDLDPNLRLFAHPFYWAAFSLTGV